MYGVAWQQASWHEMEDGMAPKSHLGCGKLSLTHTPLAIFSCLFVARVPVSLRGETPQKRFVKTGDAALTIFISPFKKP